jgi:ankyrin repeat protein
MDPLSITVSVITLIQVTHSVLLSCYRLKGQIKDAESEITKVIDEAEQLSSILDHINSILEQNPAAAPMLAPIAADGKGPLNAIKSALVEIKDKITPLAKPGLKSKLLWPFESKSFQRLLAIIQNQKSTLQLALSSCQTKMLVEQANTGKELHNAIGSVGDQVVGAVGDLEKKRKRDAMFKWYKSCDPEQNHQRSRSKHEPDTAKWIFDVREFQSWKTQDGESLWINGVPGAGKTILCSTIIDHMQEMSKDTESRVVYYYFDFSDSTKQSLSSLLKSLIFQVVSEPGSDATSAEALYDKCNETMEPSLDELLGVLIDLARLKTTYLFIDALDECPESERELFFKSFFESSLPTPINILITSRKEYDIESALKDKVAHNISIQSADVDADVRIHVENAITQDPAFRKWKPAIRQEMLDAIVSGSHGMFRWAVCQLDALKKCLTPAMVRAELKRMPQTLDGTYDRILQGIPDLHKAFVQSAMNWLAFSRRPLTLSELAEAAVVDPKSERFDPDECRFVDERLILSLCGSLVTSSLMKYKPGDQDWLTEKYEMQFGWGHSLRAVDAQVVTLSHFSVKEYITSQRLVEGSLSAFYISERLGHRFLTDCCLRYLIDMNLHEMDTTYGRHFESLPLYQYSARFWMDHWKSSVMDDEDKNDLLYVLFDASDPAGYVNWLSCYAPDSYADKRMIRNGTPDLSIHAYPRPIYYAALLGDLALVQYVGQQGCDMFAIEGHFGSAFAASVFHGHVEVVKYFLDHGADPNLRVRGFGCVLQAAAAGGSVDVVKILLDAGADVNAQGGGYNTALVAAASQEHHDVVSLLIKSGADINVGGADGSSLYQACAAGDTKTVITLLGAGADINDTTGQGTPLHGAAWSGKTSLVQLLIRRGADVNKGTGHGSSQAIVAAAENGHAQIVRILLNAGADPNAGTGLTALEAAIKSGDMPTFRAVLDGGGNPNVLFSSYANAFHCAIYTGELPMAKILLERGAEFEDRAFVESVKRFQEDPYFCRTLLERGANVDAQDGTDGSALHFAIKEGGEDAVWLLLQKDPYLDSVAQNGTPLCEAVSRGMTDVVKELIRRGANVGRSVNWNSPLGSACEDCNKDLATILLDAGADVNFGGGIALNYACLNKNEDLVRFLVRDYGADVNMIIMRPRKFSPMQRMAAERNIPMMKLLLGLGADINGPVGKEGTILYCAMNTRSECTKELIDFLLDNGATVDDSVEGNSILCAAIRAKMTEFIPRLIENGADVKQTSQGMTALAEAFVRGDQSLVDLLLDHGSQFTDSGDALMLEAVRKKSLDDIRLLLDNGVDPNASDGYYNTALGVSATK